VFVWEWLDRAVEAPLLGVCGTTQSQFRDFQIHFVEQYFGESGRAARLVGHTKLPFLLHKLAPEFSREERRPRVFVGGK
jgi:hypothetical protein